MDSNEKIKVEFDVFKWESIRNYLELTNEIDYKIINKELTNKNQNNENRESKH